ncbi:MAG: HutD family protein, partial [Bdellovibrionaceae bacterium]|nr:HutD family protein [Pseudobdellovibrionaceae bacterium]
MPWKNGGGSTSQIQIFPQDADPAGESFLWRLSSAAVTGPGPFSLFKGYDRWLVILRGDGLVLNGTNLQSEKPFKFSGDVPIHCQILGDEVIDLGLIYR